MHSHTKKFIVGLVAATLLAPALAFAQTSDKQAQIQALLAQIASLQAQVKALMASDSGSGAPWTASSTSPGIKMMPPGQVGKMLCIKLERNLGPGSHGDDVKSLQEALGADSSAQFTSASTGVFGPITAQALMRFQKNNGIPPTGNIGPLTRALFERRCGEGLGNGNGGAMGNGMGSDNGGPTNRPQPQAMGMAVTGMISANNGTSIVVTNKANMSRTVNFTTSTKIEIFTTLNMAPTVGASADLTVGKPVAAEGTTNADGSLTAVHIKIGMPPPPPPKSGSERSNGDT